MGTPFFIEQARRVVLDESCCWCGYQDYGEKIEECATHAEIANVLADVYRAGQLAMRERASQWVESCREPGRLIPLQAIVEQIRALQPEEPK